MMPPIRVTCREGQVRRDGRVADTTTWTRTNVLGTSTVKDKETAKGLLDASSPFKGVSPVPAFVRCRARHGT